MSYNRGGSYYSPRYGNNNSHNPSKKYDSHNEGSNNNLNANSPANSTTSSASSAGSQGSSNPRRERDHYSGSASGRYDGTIANNGKYNKYLPKSSNVNSTSDSNKNSSSTSNNNGNPNTYYGSASSSNINSNVSSNIPKRRPNAERYDSYTSPSIGGKLYSSSVSSNDDRLHRSYSENSINKDKKGPSSGLNPGSRSSSHHHSTHHSTSTSSSRPSHNPTSSNSKIPTSSIPTSTSTGFRDDRRKSSSSITPSSSVNTNIPHNHSHSHSHHHHEDKESKSKSSSAKPLSNSSSKPPSNVSSRHSSIGIDNSSSGIRRKSSFHDSKTVSPMTAANESNKDEPQHLRLEKSKEKDSSDIEKSSKNSDSVETSNDIIKTSFAAYAKLHKEHKSHEHENNGEAEQSFGGAEKSVVGDSASSTKDYDTTSTLSSLPYYDAKASITIDIPLDDTITKSETDKKDDQTIDNSETNQSKNTEAEDDSIVSKAQENPDDEQDVSMEENIQTIEVKYQTHHEAQDQEQSVSNAADKSEIKEQEKEEVNEDVTLEDSIVELEKIDDAGEDVVSNENESVTVAKETLGTTSTGDISILSPLKDIPSEDFNFNELATINEGGDTSNVLEDINEDEIENEDDIKSHDDMNDDESNDEYNDEHELSEAETVVAESPQRGIRGRRLIRKKEFDEERHNLKKKALHSSGDKKEDEEVDENDEDDFEAAMQDPGLRNMTDNEYNDDERRDINNGRPNVSDVNSGDEIKPMSGKPYKIKRDAGGRSFLQRACKKGSLEEVKNYISRGASANEKDFCGFTCLHEAALAGHTSIVKYLLDHGADVNAQSDAAGDSDTALIDAAENKHIDTVRILLEYGADPTIYNIDGFTALTKIYNEHAGERAYSEIIKLLENANANFTQTQKHEITRAASPSPRTIVEDPNDTYFADLIKRKGIFKYAAEGSKEVTANHFVSGNSLSDKPDILILAARNGHAELVDIILGLNPTPYDIDTENDVGVTALLASVGRGHYDIVESLLSKDADPFRKRKQDNLNALEISERSVHFDPKEIKLLEDCMNKKVASKSGDASAIQSGATSAIGSTVGSDAEDGSMTPIFSDRESSKLMKIKFNDEKKRKHEISHPKALKKHKSEVKIKQQSINVSKPDISRDTAHESPIRRDQSMSPPPDRTKIRSASASPSPSPVPLTKQQEEAKAKGNLEAKVWREKAEAKRRARKETFLKSEKEKEKRRKEEEEKRLEEEQRLAVIREEERIKLAQEAETRAKELGQERKKLISDMIKENLPVGLRTFRFNNENLTEKAIDMYTPLYIFEIDRVDYITDLQITLLTSLQTQRVLKNFKSDDVMVCNETDKSKLWQLFFNFIGIDIKDTTFDFKTQRREGHKHFQNLMISLIKFEDTVPFIKEQFPLTYSCVWEDLRNKSTRVSLATIQPYSEESDHNLVVNEEDMEVVVDTKNINKFIPPRLEFRKDPIRVISNSNRPLW
ncbi:hypothetical protein DFJ63DRAFT_101423 [Scheffersomyces coipomensis]|uniref:uncharacterized protein n=1 Tax=Scheffersomyces coipomensis TaxID=1788519 RepID=UPI00315DDEC5